MRPELALDKALFTEPLTLVIEGKMKKVIARQNGKKLPIVLRSGKAWFEFDPFGGEIMIKIK